MSDVQVLEPVAEKIELEVSEKFEPTEFFKDREGLFVWSGFTSNILSEAKPVEAGAKFAVTSSKLLEDLSDEKIENALGENHLFSETDVCAIIAELISKQPKGEEGNLLNNGYANLFYTPSRVVCVGWRVDVWYVCGWQRGGCGWDAGCRVFSPATVS